MKNSQTEKTTITPAPINDLSMNDNGSALKQLVFMIDKRGSVDEGRGLAFPISLRLNPGNHCSVEAMAKLSGKSKNIIANELLAVGIAYTIDNLSDESRHSLDELSGKVMHNFLKKSPDYADFFKQVKEKVK